MEEIWLRPYVSQDFDPKAAAEARKAEMAGMNEQIDQRLKEIFSVERFIVLYQ